MEIDQFWLYTCPSTTGLFLSLVVQSIKRDQKSPKNKLKATLSLLRPYKLHHILLPLANEVCEGYVFTPVCHSVHRGGVCLSACWDTPTPRSRHPREQTPPRADTPGSRHPQEQTPPLGADIPPHSKCWEIRATSGRYASYSNAY